MLELDVLLVPFTRQVLPHLPAVEQRQYVRLLAHEDQELYAWFMERGAPQDPDLARLVRKIIDYARRA
jgi:antitoxin CptB